MADPAESDSYPPHGGDIAFATARYGSFKAGWLDLSTGINPNPYPASDVPSAALSSLPDPLALTRLLSAARTAYAIPDDVAAVALPGTEIAIRLLPLVAPQGPVAVIGPTYSSHGDAWRNAGRTVAEIIGAKAIPDESTIVVVANPNNPDGHTIPAASLADLARKLGRRGGLLIVDEAFADVAPNISLVPHLVGLPAVVLRSFGKFYGLAGLRLGFAAGEPPTIARLASTVGDWPVSTPALTIGTEALSDLRWGETTRASLAEQCTRLRALLSRHGLAIKGHTDLFVLIEEPDAAGLHRRLAEHGIWTRIFAHQPTWLRLGQPGTGMDRLDRALTACR